MQVHGHYMILDKVKIPLNFLFRVYFGILKSFNQNIYKRIFLISEEMWSSVNNFNAVCVYSHLQGLHTRNGRVYSFYAHFTHLCRAAHLACNKLDISWSMWHWYNTFLTSRYSNEIQKDWALAWPWNVDFPKSEHLCQLLEDVCNCVDLRNSNVISAPSSVRRPEIPQTFRIFGEHCYRRIKSRNYIFKFIISVHLSVGLCA